MRLQKEELATVLILLCALAAIGVLYVFLSGSALAQYNANSKDGDTVYAQGTLLSNERTHTGGHLILSLKTDAGPVTVFVASSSDCYDVAKGLQPGRQVKTTGTVKLYQDEKEIIPDSISYA